MAARPILSIPQPCHESWDAMTPNAVGRHCAACAKTVIDFTGKTDAEILAYLAKAAGTQTCGRFVAHQLDRPLQPAMLVAPMARWRAWLVAAVAVWGLREAAGVSAKAQASMQMQSKVDKPVISHNLQAMRKPDYEGGAGSLVLRGVIMDSTTHEGLAWATILIKNSTVGVATKEDGTFELTIPAEYVHNGIVEIQTRYLGYFSEERHLAVNKAAEKLTFLLQPDARSVLSGALVVVDTKKIPPAPWHPRSLYRWAKYQLMRPFRR